MRSWFRIGMRLGVLAGVAFALVVATRSRRSGGGAGGPGGLATGVHGQWPDVRPASAGAPTEGAAGDHHPHGRVTVPRQAAPLGAPPAVASEGPGPAEPEAPEPREHLDSEGQEPGGAGTAPRPARPAGKKAPARKAAGKDKARTTGKAPVRESGKATAPASAPWVEPEGKTCPATHPVKAKLSSRLYHLPGMLAYDRTVPDRCYVDPPAAEADGFSRAKR